MEAVHTCFCPVLACGPWLTSTHRGYHLKHVCAPLLGRGWIGVAGCRVVSGVGHWQHQDKWPLYATFGEVKGGTGREEAANKGCLYPFSSPASPPPFQPLQLIQWPRTVTGWSGVCVWVLESGTSEKCEMEGNSSEGKQSVVWLNGTSAHYAKLLLYPTVKLLALCQGSVSVPIHLLPHPYTCVPVVCMLSCRSAFAFAACVSIRTFMRNTITMW